MKVHNNYSETIRGIVERVTFHNEINGWSVLRVKCFKEFEACTVIVHQTKVFAGASMKFSGSWANHPKFGRQFKAVSAVEEKPASAAALEKYLGSGLIKGVGSKTARRIVKYFGDKTLTVFEESIEDLLQVPGIAQKKLETISSAWKEHRGIRDVMIFLQKHGISTLFAVRIYKKYGQKAIEIVSNNPYQLANDFYGIGFFSADKVALSFGIMANAPIRVFAAIRHILAASREKGHCYLTMEQIQDEVQKLLDLDLSGLMETYLQLMEKDGLLKKRIISSGADTLFCYYSKTLYFDEKQCASDICRLCHPIQVDRERVKKWLDEYGKKRNILLSDEQDRAVRKIASCGLSILTGGPGCGKTTATKTLAGLFLAMGKELLLAAPTGRAAQRMEEVIGIESKTIHRLLEFQNNSFQKNRDNQLVCDVLIVDECSMLDISLAAALFAAVPTDAQLVLIGDADQLPSVGAGNVLGDMIVSGTIPNFHLSKIFRQAEDSTIITYAHEMNAGIVPKIPSPFKFPGLWTAKCDCLFLDSSEATQKQLHLIKKAKKLMELSSIEEAYGLEKLYGSEADPESRQKNHHNDDTFFKKEEHVDFGLLQTAENEADELRAVMKNVHPWSSLYYGLTAAQVLIRLYTEWIPKYFGTDTEIQVLSPMTRGSLGTVQLNATLQAHVNPPRQDKGQITLGERIFRVGDRVIHRRNNYDLGVYNGDIGKVIRINSIDLTCVVNFFSDGRDVEYQRDQLSELDLAYAITIHKAQGSEFDCVIIPLVSQHFNMLFRNLLYTGLTRAKKLAAFTGSRQALGMAVRNSDSSKRQTALVMLLQEGMAA